MKNLVLSRKCIAPPGSGLLVLLIVFVLTFFSHAQGQRLTISGTVMDENGAGLLGAGILEKGTSNGTITNSGGQYTIEAARDATLVFSFVGYRSLEIPVNNRSAIDASLEVEVTTLAEVVVTGYSTQNKADVTGAISIVNMEQIIDIPKANPMSALQGRVPGLYVENTGRPSGATSVVLIRGMNTLGNNDPLYVIDGVPTKSKTPFQDLEPNSIESIQVLKDASAASIYGARASNGVIIVTTKAGQGTVKVEFNSRTTMQKHTRRVEVMNTLELGEALWQASINDGTNPAAHSALYSYDYTGTGANAVLSRVIPVEWVGGDPAYKTKAQVPGTDWQDVVYRTGWIYNNTLSISGGTENTTALVNLGYFKNRGIMAYQDFEKVTLRINTSHKMLGDKLKIGQNLNIAGTSEVPEVPGMEWFATNLHPILPVYTEDGKFSGPIGAGFSDRNNPLLMFYMNRNNRNNTKLAFGNIYAEITPFKNLLFRSNFGLDYTFINNWNVQEAYQAGFMGRQVNSLFKTMGIRLNWIWSNTLTYHLDMKKHSFDFLSGMEAIKENYEYMNAYREQFALNGDYDYMLSLTAGTGLQTNDGTITGYQLLSYFGKVNYALSDKYLASATLRYDGSSRFGTKNQFGLFPAMTVGWRINNEKFFKVAAVSNLKLRAGIGRVGNQEIGDIARFGLYVPGYGLMNFGLQNTGTAYDLYDVNTGTLPSGFVRTQVANDKVKWETTGELNIGIDFGFLEEKIIGSFDYFTRTTDDILIKPPYPAVVGGGGSRWENGATVENRGFEIVLGYRDRAGDFSYNIMGNLSSFHDEITYLPEAVVRAYPGNVEKTILGHSRTSIFGYITDGLFQNQAEVDAHVTQLGKGIGRIRYKDLNNDGVINPMDQDWIGTTLPKAEYGISGDVAYKNITLSVFMSGVAGKKANDWIMGVTTKLNYPQLGMNAGTAALDAWTPNNTDSDIPALTLVDANNEARSSDYWYRNVSYFKLRNLQLSYTVPAQITQKMRLKLLRIYLLGENLFVIQDNKGKDRTWFPDAEAVSAGLSGFGRSYLLPISITGGLNVTF